MSFSATVTRSPAEFIRPCSATAGGKLPLSQIDKNPLLRTPVETMLVFGGSSDVLTVGKTIREGLSKALVPYYPVAGKLSAEDDGGDLCVECTGEGVLFVEARANCSLHDVDYLCHPLRSISEEDLLPVQPLGDRILMVQVTEFRCGGYAVCYTATHVFFDATGISQFLKAVGEMARGFKCPATKPVWDRQLIPGPMKKDIVAPPALPSLVPLQLVYATIDISPGTVNNLREQFVESTGRKCTVFEAVVAAIWQCRIRAIAFEPTAEVSLVFAMNLRPLLRQEGYYGNCAHARTVTESSKNIANARHAHVVDLIQESKRRSGTDFWKWVKGEEEDKPPVRFNNYGNTIVSDFRTMGFYDVDFGSGGGTPILCTDLLPMDYLPGIIMTYPLRKSDGVRLITKCVRNEHLKAFRDQINALASVPTLHPRL